MDLEPGVEERTDEPGPHGSLVVGGIARTQIAIVLRFVVGMTRRQGTQTHRREQTLPDYLQYRLPTVLFQDSMGQGDSEYLVGAASPVVTLLAVHDIVKIAAVRIPEAAVKGVPGPLRLLGQRAGSIVALFLTYPGLQQAQAVIPQGVDLHRLAAARRDDPIADLGIHPGQL